MIMKHHGSLIITENSSFNRYLNLLFDFQNRSPLNSKTKLIFRLWAKLDSNDTSLWKNNLLVKIFIKLKAFPSNTLQISCYTASGSTDCNTIFSGIYNACQVNFF